ncbi:MAG TPA: hypothetical protein VNN07_07015 [Candidatus Tectomicrobia bacterium]|nr:hypothetical protein [Candidatus Tectomicrobia bacterium]
MSQIDARDLSLHDMREATFRIAAALLLRYREISLAAMEALPFVAGRENAERLADELTRRLGAVRDQKRIVGSGVVRWEDVIRLAPRPEEQRALR